MTRAFYWNKVLRDCPVGAERIGGVGEWLDRMQKARSMSAMLIS